MACTHYCKAPIAACSGQGQVDDTEEHQYVTRDHKNIHIYIIVIILVSKIK